MENKNVKQTKEKMIKSCKAVKLFIEVLKCLFIIGIISGIIVTFLLIKPVDESEGNLVSNETIENTDSYAVEVTENDWIKGIKILLTFSIILSVEKMLKEIIEKETPFTEKNIKTLKTMSLLAIAFAIAARGFTIVFALAIVIIAHIFKYGYQLQLESDEIL